MLSRFKQFLAPPVFPDDPDKTAVAKILNAIALFFLIILFIVIPILTIFSGGFVRTLSWAIPTFFVLLGVKGLIAKGYVDQASLMLILMLWLVSLFSTATAGGVQAPGFSVFVVFVVLAGLLLGWRFALGVAFLNSSLGLVFLWLESQGRLHYSPLPDNDFHVWLFHMITAVVIVVLLKVGVGSIREALARAQNELHQRQLSEERLAKIFRASPTALVISEIESGIVLDVNNQFEQLLGYSREELIGKTATELDVYGDARGRRIWVEDVVTHGFIHDLETSIRIKNGEYRACLMSVEAIELMDKPCAIVFVQDITEKKLIEIDNERTRDDLRKQEAQLRTILNNLPFWMWLKDDNGRFLLVNETMLYQRLDSKNLTEIIGKTDADFISSAATAGRYLTDEEQVMEKRISVLREEIVSVGGEERIFETYKAPFLDNDNQILGTFGFARDITKSKRAEETLLESESRFRSIFEEAPIGMVLVSLNHNIIVTNQAFASMLGYEKEELIGTYFKDITYPDDIELSVKNHEMLIQGRLTSYQFEKRYMHKQGGTVWALLHVSLIHSAEGKPVHAIAQVQNIADRKQAELDNEMLIRELERRNAELERFAYTVSHDLKSPLVTIGGFLGFLERDTEQGNMDRIRIDIESIQTAVEKMRQLLDELLELSRIGRLINPPEEIAYKDIIDDALAVTHGNLINCEVSIVGDISIVILGDRVRLVEVVQNLIDNAAKFMGEQPAPHITIGVREVEAVPVFFVQDNGIGIPSRHQDHIFDIFNKLNPGVEGTGIGLSLVKRIVEVHNGRLWVESEGLGQGSTFCFTLNEAALLKS